MNKKKTVVSLLAFCMTAAALAGCGSSNTAAPAVDTKKADTGAAPAATEPAKKKIPLL